MLDDNCCDGFDELCLWHSADNLLRDLSVLEQNQVGNATYAILRWGTGIVINVHLYHFKLSRVFTSKFIDNRRNCTARVRRSSSPASGAPTPTSVVVGIQFALCAADSRLGIW